MAYIDSERIRVEYEGARDIQNQLEASVADWRTQAREMESEVEAMCLKDQLGLGDLPDLTHADLAYSTRLQSLFILGKQAGLPDSVLAFRLDLAEGSFYGPAELRGMKE